MGLVGDRQVIEIDGVATSYVDTGSGPPLVLIHGGDPGRGSTGALIWHRNIQGLAQSHRVLALDRLGTGHTDNPASPDDYRMSAMCRHVEAFLDQLGIRQATVVGQSRGAYVTAWLARARPDQVRRFVIVNSASLAPDVAVKRQITLDNYRGLPETVEADERWLSVGDSHITPAWIAEATELLESARATEVRGTYALAQDAYYREMEHDKAGLLAWYQSGGCQQPSLIVWGTGDPSLGIEAAVDTFNLMNHGGAPVRLYVMNDAGHHCFAERPGEFNEVISMFLRIGSEEPQA